MGFFACFYFLPIKRFFIIKFTIFSLGRINFVYKFENFGKSKLWLDSLRFMKIVQKKFILTQKGKPSSLLVYFLVSLWTGLGLRSFAHIAQIKCVTVSDSLRSLRTNERLWANCSGRSCQKSDCEGIAQVTHDKWAAVSDSLRSLMLNERMSNSRK